MFFNTCLFRVWRHGPNCKGGVQEARFHDCLQTWSVLQPNHQLAPLQTQFLTRARNAISLNLQVQISPFERETLLFGSILIKHGLHNR